MARGQQEKIGLGFAALALASLDAIPTPAFGDTSFSSTPGNSTTRLANHVSQVKARWHEQMVGRCLRYLDNPPALGNDYNPDDGLCALWDSDPSLAAALHDPRVQLKIAKMALTESDRTFSPFDLLFHFPRPCSEEVLDLVSTGYKSESPRVKLMAFSIMCAARDPRFLEQYFKNLLSEDRDLSFEAADAICGLATSGPSRKGATEALGNSSSLDQALTDLGVVMADTSIFDRLKDLCLTGSERERFIALDLLTRINTAEAARTLVAIYTAPALDPNAKDDCLAEVFKTPPNFWPKLDNGQVKKFLASGNSDLISQLAREVAEPGRMTITTGQSLEELKLILQDREVQDGVLNSPDKADKNIVQEVAAMLKLADDPALRERLVRYLEDSSTEPHVRMVAGLVLPPVSTVDPDYHKALQDLLSWDVRELIRNWGDLSKPFRGVRDQNVIISLKAGFARATHDVQRAALAAALAETGDPEGIQIAKEFICRPEPMDAYLVVKILDPLLRAAKDETTAVKLLRDSLLPQAYPVDQEFPNYDGLALVPLSMGCESPGSYEYFMEIAGLYSVQTVRSMLAEFLSRPLSPLNTGKRNVEVGGFLIALDWFADHPSSQEGALCARRLIDEHLDIETNHSKLIAEASLNVLVKAYQAGVDREDICQDFSRWLTNGPKFFRDFVARAARPNYDPILSQILADTRTESPFDAWSEQDELAVLVKFGDMQTINSMLSRIDELSTDVPTDTNETREIRQLSRILAENLNAHTIVGEPTILPRFTNLCLPRLYGGTPPLIQGLGTLVEASRRLGSLTYLIEEVDGWVRRAEDSGQPFEGKDIAQPRDQALEVAATLLEILEEPR